MSYYAWKLVQNEMKNRKINMNDPSEIAEMVNEITVMMTDNAKKNKQIRQQHLRFKKGTQHIQKHENKSVSQNVQETYLEEIQHPIPIKKLNVYHRNNLNRMGE